MDKALWVPLAVLFGAAVITALVKRYTKDPCLKIFDRCFVFVRLKTGKWLWGNLVVYSNTLELRYTSSAPFHGSYEKCSYVLYEQNLENIDRILRPSPAAGTEEHARWQKEVQRLQRPSLGRRFMRKARNTVNVLRDAFAQSIVLIFGAARKTRTLAKVQIGDDKVSEVGRSLINVVPNAYEPVLEQYLGRNVVIESVQADTVLEQAGVLQEYSAKYILIRAAEFLQDLPPAFEAGATVENRFDVIFPRQIHSVRHLAARNLSVAVD
jgi:hypothetical protein